MLNAKNKEQCRPIDKKKHSWLIFHFQSFPFYFLSILACDMNNFGLNRCFCLRLIVVAQYFCSVSFHLLAPFDSVLLLHPSGSEPLAMIRTGQGTNQYRPHQWNIYIFSPSAFDRVLSTRQAEIPTFLCVFLASQIPREHGWSSVLAFAQLYRIFGNSHQILPSDFSTLDNRGRSKECAKSKSASKWAANLHRRLVFFLGSESNH